MARWLTAQHLRWPRPAWRHVGILVILILSLALHLVRLERVGFGNLYYAAAVKSMMSNAKLFFFASFDPGGFVTVDKPPLGLWIQAASAWALGFSGIALLLPQVFAGTASVGVVYLMLRKRAGETAALVAALLLALTPVFVATNRNNTMDSTLLLVVLLGSWALLVASERGSLRYLLLAFLLIGIGFNIKMMQAYMVLPAFYLVYLGCTAKPWKRRVAQLAAATGLLLVVSLAWVVAVDLTPADMRPYIGSTVHNRMLELTVGHNAMARLAGPRAMGRGPQGPPRNGPRIVRPRLAGPMGPGPGLRPGPPRGPGGNETGPPSLGRLFEKPLAGQASWFLVLAFLGFLAAWCGPRRGMLMRNRLLLFWMAWLLPMVVFFSYAGLFHRYYLAMLAPAVAALCGMGLVAMARAWRGPGWRGWMLPAALVATVAAHVWIVSPFGTWSAWLRPVLLAGGIVGVVAILAGRWASDRLLRGISLAGVIAAGLVLLAAPALWSATPILYGDDATLPFAGPELRDHPHRPGQGDRLERLIAYLQEHRNGEKFLVAVPNAMLAAPIILQTGEPVMATGGFGGHDHILTPEALREKVDAGEVRYFVLQQGGPRPGPGPGGDAEVGRWVRRNAGVVPPWLYLDEIEGWGPGRGRRRSPLLLFDVTLPPQQRPAGLAEIPPGGPPEF